MNRTATTLATLTSFLLVGGLAAADPATAALEARINSIESRLNSIEATLGAEVGSSAYQQNAMLEATRAGETVGGQTEKIPSPPLPETKAPALASDEASTTYVIQDGDTLGKIAAKFKIERKALLEANRLSEGQPIYIGETLMIPGQPAPTADTKKIADTKTPEAKQDAVVVGETKKPGPAPTSVHTVAKGDTLTSLAKKYGTSVESLKSANGLRGDVISLGQALKIPAKDAGSQASAPQPEAGKPEQSSAFQYDNPLLKSDETYGYYTVAKGDNLYALARDFFTTMAELQRINNLGSSTTIFPGDDLIVPTSKYNAYHQKGEMANR